MDELEPRLEKQNRKNRPHVRIQFKTENRTVLTPAMWKRLQHAVNRVILEISAVRRALNG